MQRDDGDSGIEAASTSESREGSPKPISIGGRAALDEPMASNKAILEDVDDIDETLAERLWGLTEMFPEGVRNGAYWAVKKSADGVKSFYSFSRTATWVFFSSSAILAAPLLFEMERMHMDDMNKQQQRQILLGPSAAVGGGMMPPGVAQSPR